MQRCDAAFKLMWHASQRIAIGIQPAFRLGNIGSATLSPQMTYGRAVVTVDSLHTSDHSPSVTGAIDSIYNYVIQEKFDSITVKPVIVGGTFWEIELPVTVQYQLSRSWHVYGGVSVNLGGKMNYTEKGETHIVSTTRRDSLAQSEPLPSAAFNNYFGRTQLASYSSYAPADYSQQPNPVRVGYLLGAGYTHGRITAEASIHQQLTGYSNVAPAMRDAFSTPYVRLSVGYYLLRHDKAK